MLAFKDTHRSLLHATGIIETLRDAGYDFFIGNPAGDISFEVFMGVHQVMGHIERELLMSCQKARVRS